MREPHQPVDFVVQIMEGGMQAALEHNDVAPAVQCKSLRQTWVLSSPLLSMHV